MARIKPLFARRHYRVVAAILREAKEQVNRDSQGRPCGISVLGMQVVQLVQDKFSALFYADNDRFKVDRFRKECDE
ncbi:MAG: hypothetical protein ABID40_00020 [Candidatus Bipolaricaulota bacterium]